MKLTKDKFYNFKILLISVLAYFFLSVFIDKSISPHTMFNHFDPDADSFSYLQVGNWLFGGDYSEHIAFRPFLFPMIVTSLYTLGGIYTLWFYQFCAYIMGHFLLNKSIEIFTNSKSAAWTGSVLYLINFSLIGLTFHALTETTVVFGLSLFIFLTVRRYKDQLSNGHYWSWTLFIIGCLTLVKPVFLFPLYFCIFLMISQFIFKRLPVKSLRVFPVISVVAAIVLQFVIMKSVYGEASISKVSAKTYRSYLLSQVVMKKEKVPRAEAIESANEMSSEQIFDYSIENYTILTSQFLENLKYNIQSDSFVEDYSNAAKNAKASRVMKWYNRSTLYVHFFIFIFGSLFFLMKIRSRAFDLVILLGMCWTVLLYYIFVTGISFDQRDRLVIGALPLWIFFLVVFSKYLIDYFKGIVQKTRRDN